MMRQADPVDRIQGAQVRIYAVDKDLISKPGYPVGVYSVSGRPAWEGKTDGVSGVDG